MSLWQLAREIVQTNRWGRRTPVLVTPPYLVLRTPFYVALVKAIADQGPSELRIDWQHHPRPSLFNGLLARRRAQQISRALFDDLSDHRASAIIEVTAAIARPDARHSAICLGVCDSRGELPTYAAPIHLAASPEDCLALQSSR